MIVVWIILGLIVALLAVLLIRTACYKPHALPAPAKEEAVTVDTEEVASHLGAFVQCKTVSHEGNVGTDYKEIEKVLTLIKGFYPVLFEKSTFTLRPDHGLVFQIAGRDRAKDKVTVLMAHYDVVPVNEGAWKHDPFLGQVTEEDMAIDVPGKKEPRIEKKKVLYGRGSLDTKTTFLGALEAANDALENGFVPAHDVFLCFGCDEEVAGTVQPHIVAWLKEQGYHPALVLDEGGAVAANVFPKVDKRAGVIGITEKGQMNVILTAESQGGHASMPPKNSPIVRLSRAIDALESHPMKAKFSPGITGLIDEMGRNCSSFGFKLIFANRWLFGGLLKKIFCASPMTNAMMRTTFAFTMVNGGNACNVMPSKVEATINIRLSTFDTIEDVLAHIKKVINDPTIKIEAPLAKNACPSTDPKSEGFKKVAAAVHATWPDAIVSPYIMLQGSDSRNYVGISDCICRFSAYEASVQDRSRIHGIDEQISLDHLTEAVTFYKHLFALL